MIEVGTVRGDGRNIFAAVLPDTPRGVRIVLDGESERLLDLYDLQRRTVAIELQETPRSRRSGRPQA